jgi:hypothetical protein
MKWLPLLLTITALGCEKRQAPNSTTFEERETEYVLAVAIDLSGSFAEQMADQGKAHEFLLQVLDRYFRDRIGSDDRVFLAQISGSGRALLWDGTPRELRRDFPTPKHFRDFLRTKAQSDGSRVHEALAETIEYVMADRAVASGRAKPALFVLSDMLDNGRKTPQLKQRVLTDLAAYGRLGGIAGFYFVDERRLKAWRQILDGAGVREAIVESSIVSRPTLPRFE